MSILGPFQKYYEDVHFHDETIYSSTYIGVNKQREEQVYLKVMDKNKLKLGDYNYLLEQIKREEEIIKLFNSQNIVKFYQKLENENIIIFEFEYLDKDLGSYLSDNGELEREKEFFKAIVLSLGKALLIIHKKGIMHRDIKPYNIFIDDNKTKIKLGDFGCSIRIKDNKSKPIGTIFYTAPEIIKNLKYDEKCDLWSLGVTLYELYFGELPYGKNVNAFKIKEAIYDEENFRFRKSNIPTLDILFKRLLVINPKNRMTFDELFQYIFNKDFMKNDVIVLNNNLEYKNIYDIILKEQEEEKKLAEINGSNNENNDYEPEGFNEEESNKHNINKIFNFLEGEHLPDIINCSNGDVNSEQQFNNNIIYYDENINYMGSLKKDSDYFEKHTPGAFLLCNNIDSLNLIKEEVLKENENDKRVIFNLVTTGRTFEKVMLFLEQNQDFKVCIINACIYCLNLAKYMPLKNKYSILYGVYNRQFEIVDFIKKFSSNKIKPFPITKLVTYEDYKEKYKKSHFTISQFYGKLTEEDYKIYYEKMKDLIEKDSKANKLKNKNKNILFEAFLSFDLKKDLEDLDKLIIREYTKNTFYGDLNKWLMNATMDFYEPVAYFTSRLMYSLNKYASENNKFCKKNKKELHRGAILPYTCLIQYKRAIGKIICLSSFTSTTENEKYAWRFSGRDQAKEIYNNTLKFSVIYIITNSYENNNWVSCGIDIHKESKYKKEKEVLFQPFTFYYVKKVKIDIENYIADIYLETVGKCEILEEKIKYGKEIEYNKDKKVIEIMN